MKANFFSLIDNTLRTGPDRELLLWPDGSAAGKSFTGRAILDRIAAVKEAVPALQPGVKVLLPVGTGLIFSLLAVMASGAVPVLPPAARPSNLLRIIRKEKIRVVFTGKNLPFPIRWLAKALGLSLVNMNEMTNSSGAWLPPQQVPPDQPALITHSSGSTGSSKVIYRSHCVLTAQHLALKTAFPPRPEQHDFPLFPNILLHNLAVGTATVFPDLPGFSVLRMAPARIVGQILSNGIQT